jgi:hypothetical protein
MATSGNAELDGVIAKITPEVAALIHALLEKARAQLPGAIGPVYDNDKALAIGFGPTDRVKDIVVSFRNAALGDVMLHGERGLTIRTCKASSPKPWRTPCRRFHAPRPAASSLNRFQPSSARAVQP